MVVRRWMGLDWIFLLLDEILAEAAAEAAAVCAVDAIAFGCSKVDQFVVGLHRGGRGEILATN